MKITEFKNGLVRIGTKEGVKNKKEFYKWFVAFCLMVAMFILAINEGFIQLMVDNDISKISLGIIALFFGCSAFTGRLAWNTEPVTSAATQKKRYLRDKGLRVMDFCKGHFFTLGILGTVVGLIYMTNNVLTGSDTKAIIVGLKDGLATSLLTTAAGLVASLLLDIQIHILRYNDSDNKS